MRLFELVPRDSLIGILIGPTLWMAAFVVIYGIAGTGCALGYADASISGLNAIRFLALLVAAISGIAIAWAGVRAWTQWKEVRRTMVEASELAERKRHEFICFSAVWLCGISLVGTVWLGIAILMNPVC
jgi:hypothetical protein